MTDTQNSAGEAVREAVENLRVGIATARTHNVAVAKVNADDLAISLARITELEAHIAAEPDRMREVVERCAEVALNISAPTKDFWEGQKAAAAAIRAQEIKP